MARLLALDAAILAAQMAVGVGALNSHVLVHHRSDRTCSRKGYIDGKHYRIMNARAPEPARFTPA